MATATATLNVKIDPAEKELFVRTAEEIGTTPSNAIKMFIRAFNDYGGFPFEARSARAMRTGYLSQGDFEAFARDVEMGAMAPEAKALLAEETEWAK